MADPQEPRVSVHGIPKSQYDGTTGLDPNAVGSAGGPPSPDNQGKKHNWMLWFALGLGGILVLWIVSRYISNGSGTGTSLAGGSSSGTSSSTSPDQLWGSQLDADYQQLISSTNAQTGILNQILTGINKPPAGSSGTPPPPPASGNPLIPFGALPTGFGNVFGQDLWLGTTEYQTGPGNNGVLWGVPVSGGKNLSLADWNKVAIAPGGKTMLYGPQSRYH